MKCFLFTLVSLLLVSFSRADVCTYKEVKLSRRDGAKGIYKIGPNVELHAADGQANRDYFDGPLSIVAAGKRRCEISGGIFSRLFVSTSGTHVLTEEFSGSSGTNRVFEISNCEIDSIQANYSGAANLENGKLLVNKPHCEPLDSKKRLASCSSGRVYAVAADCNLKLDEAASHALTKKEVGIELPISGSFQVINVGTSKAMLEK